MNQDITDLGTILGIWAHPDDEAYLMGGLMAAATAAGQRVACVVATSGDAGETSDEARWPQRELSTIRKAELRRALEILGIDEHENLNLPDGGLADVDPSEPVDQLTAFVHEVAPDTVITFGPDGMTGHPDHVTISTWVDRSLTAASHQARLLHATKTPGWVERFSDLNQQVFVDAPPPLTPDDVAISFAFSDDVIERKVRALEAHASQTLGLISAVGREYFAAWVRQEFFIDARAASRAARHPSSPDP
jgi:LmbE family N-acetylglucosaminyl deacetylase